MSIKIDLKIFLFALIYIITKQIKTSYTNGILATTLISINLGENILFSPGGIGILSLIFILSYKNKIE